MNLEFLESLLGQITVSGNEEAGAMCVVKEMEGIAHEIRTDEIGDVVCILNPDHPYKILVAAHLDEIGLLVTHITDTGRLRVVSRGGIIPVTYPGHGIKVQTATGEVYGVVESCREFLKQDPLNISEFSIDIGVSTKEEAQALVELGDSIVFDTPIRYMAGNKICARALDNRVGVFIIMEAMKKAAQKGCEVGVYCAATVGEETTKNGAYWTAARVKPTEAIGFDVTYNSEEIGGNPAVNGDVHLGGGPVLCNCGLVVKSMNQRLRACAKTLGISVQVEANDKLTYTDVDKIHFANEGIPTALVSIPLRYMHHPAEVADLQDVQDCIDLLCEFFITSDKDACQSK